MSRIVNTDGPGQKRNRHRRTIAEALRHLMEKPEVDEESKDLAALIVLSLREIDRSVDQTAVAWEKRNYFVKADRFRREWAWVPRAADELEVIIRTGRWKRLPVGLATLLPHFADITVTKYVRAPSLWANAYRRLLESESTWSGM
ncbi:MAG: hypothetical protein GXP41_05480 [Chloroflexi bacterium]|nr:hypothetical protein [Chloroflexota bacterium]